MFSEAEYNPVGSYIKEFDLDKELCGKRVIICFEGVEEEQYIFLWRTRELKKSKCYKIRSD